MTNSDSLIRKTETYKDIDFGDIFNKSIELFKKVWVQGLLLQLFTLAAMLPIIIVVYLPFIGAIIAEQESGFGDAEL